MNTITLQQEDQTVEKIVEKLNGLVEKSDLFVEAGRIVYEEINLLGNLEYGEQARIIRKVAEHPKLKYSPQQVKEAWMTIKKFPKLLGGAPHLLPSSKYNLLARTRLTTSEIEEF